MYNTHVLRFPIAATTIESFKVEIERGNWSFDCIIVPIRIHRKFPANISNSESSTTWKNDRSLLRVREFRRVTDTCSIRIPATEQDYFQLAIICSYTMFYFNVHFFFNNQCCLKIQKYKRYSLITNSLLIFSTSSVLLSWNKKLFFMFLHENRLKTANIFYPQASVLMVISHDLS